MSVRVITAPSTNPVTLAEAKAHLSVDFSDDDDIINVFIEAATDYAQKWTGRAFVQQSLEYISSSFPADGDPIELPMPPLISVSGVFYSQDGVETEVDASEYLVDAGSDPAIISSLGAWPTLSGTVNKVIVRYAAGYLTDDSPSVGDVPGSIRVAILLLVGTLYANRETVVVGQVPIKMPWSAEQLLRQYRVETSVA